MLKVELLNELILAYSTDLATMMTASKDNESERKIDIIIFIQQLRVMLAGEATDVDVEVSASTVTDIDESSARHQKRARFAVKGPIGVWKLERRGTIFLYA